MNLNLRVDDYPGTKPEEFTNHNLQNFKMFHNVLVKAGVKKYVLGVIPGYTMPADLQWLGKQEEIVVAIHGVAHNESHSDEFRDMTYRDIENALSRVKSSFEATLGRRVVDYIPPHNTLNGDTVLALSRLGFDRIYGGPETSEEMADFVCMNGMDYIHSQVPCEYGRSDELVVRGSVQYMLDHPNSTLTLHWPWEWNIGLNSLRKYLELLNND